MGAALGLVSLRDSAMQVEAGPASLVSIAHTVCQHLQPHPVHASTAHWGVWSEALHLDRNRAITHLHSRSQDEGREALRRSKLHASITRLRFAWEQSVYLSHNIVKQQLFVPALSNRIVEQHLGLVSVGIDHRQEA